MEERIVGKAKAEIDEEAIGKTWMDVWWSK